ncbi:hypothetical protein J6590_003795 [Homalodisca vitripennis]|nr:hypothetical protein J6590_003795 [Homalodisca vitripennis]
MDPKGKTAVGLSYLVVGKRSEYIQEPMVQCSGYGASRAWLLLGWVTAERSCPCKQPACPAIGGGWFGRPYPDLAGPQPIPPPRIKYMIPLNKRSRKCHSSLAPNEFVTREQNSGNTLTNVTRPRESNSAHSERSSFRPARCPFRGNHSKRQDIDFRHSRANQHIYTGNDEQFPPETNVVVLPQIINLSGLPFCVVHSKWNAIIIDCNMIATSLSPRLLLSYIKYNIINSLWITII